MDRVSTSLQNQSMLTELLRTQRNMLDAQREVSTGKRIHEFADSPSELAGLLAARGADARSADFAEAAKAAQGRLNLQDTHIDEFAGIVASLRQASLDAVANDSATTVMAEAEGAFSRMVSILNTQVDGKYIYGGTRQDVPPVTATTLDQLLALPDVAGAFQNNTIRQTAQIGENETIAFGALASDLGTPAFQALRDLAQFSAGPDGNFSDDLTTQQADFLTGLSQTFEAVASNVNQQLATNGLAYNQAKTAVKEQGDMRATLAEMISDIEDVDMAEALSKLTNAQTAMQASAQTFSMVQRMSLMDFLPVA